MQMLKTLFLSLMVLLFITACGGANDTSFSPKVERKKLENTHWFDQSGILFKEKSNHLRFWQNDDFMVGSDDKRAFIVRKIIPIAPNSYKAEVAFHGIQSTFNVSLHLDKGKLEFVDAKQAHRSFYFSKTTSQPKPSRKGVQSCMTPALIQKVDEAQSLRDKGAYKEALEIYRAVHKVCPDKNIEDGMAWLLSQIPTSTPTIDASLLKIEADKYRYGIEVAPDQQKALSLYQKAADAGDSEAMAALAGYYQDGIWIKKDLQRAKALLQEAVRAGSVSAEWELEFMEVE